MTGYDAIYENKDEICEALAFTLSDDVNMQFEACAVAFSKFIVTCRSINFKITTDTIISFFVAQVFHILKIKTCNPEKLNIVCEKLKKDIA